MHIEAYERSPVTGLHLKNCRFMNVRKGNALNHVKDVTVDNVKINGHLVDDTLEAR